MVDVEGDLKPFRIDRQELMKLVSHIKQRFDDALRPVKTIDITVERYSEKCGNIDALTAFLDDIHMPKVIKNLTLHVYGHGNLSVFLYFDTWHARYSISDAKDMSEVKSIEDTILEFFRKHSTSWILSQFNGIYLGLGLFLVAFADIILNVQLSLLYRPFPLLLIVCLVAFLVYMVWANFTPNTPPFSFVHSIVYIEKPSNNAVWILISTIIIGIVISVVSSWFG